MKNNFNVFISWLAIPLIALFFSFGPVLALAKQSEFSNSYCSILETQIIKYSFNHILGEPANPEIINLTCNALKKKKLTITIENVNHYLNSLVVKNNNLKLKASFNAYKHAFGNTPSKHQFKLLQDIILENNLASFSDIKTIIEMNKGYFEEKQKAQGLKPQFLDGASFYNLKLTDYKFNSIGYLLTTDITHSI